MTRDYDAIVLGGGAAGLFFAGQAGQRGKRVLLLEHNSRLGRKILISGGGRCNFTNLHCGPENFLSANPHFAKSALAGYTSVDFIELVQSYKIAYHEKTLGQLFCDGSASEILNMLLEECRRGEVEVKCGQHVSTVDHGDGFTVRTAAQTYHAPALIVATGGLSIPKIGATSFGYQIASQFGHKLQPCRPALVPLVFTDTMLDQWSDLSGISMDVVAGCNRQVFREKMLFTHRGVSGPAILQISSYWKSSETVCIDLAPQRRVFELSSSHDSASAQRHLRLYLAARFADRWIERHAPARWNRAGVEELERNLHSWCFQPSGDEGYGKAEVTGGGVDTSELSAKTMESRRVPGLFFIGEVVDVTGHLGGFNFQWAWSSAYAAAQAR